MATPGPGEILDLIRRQVVVTRRDISRVTGLSRVTVTQRVDALRAAGLIYESGPDESTGGRRPARLSVNYDYGLVLGAVLDTTRAELCATNLAGEAVASGHRDIRIADGAAVVLDEVIAGFRKLLRQAQRRGRDVQGIGVSVPGPVDPHTMRLNRPPLMPGWHDFDIAGHLRAAYDVPVVLENDANATALGEQVSHHPDATTLCLIKVSTGIGCGIVVCGKVLAGADGGSGDIGHIRLDGYDELCTCGSHGCLAAVASGGALATRLRSGGRDVQSVADVRRDVERGDPDSTRLVRDAGRLIGRVASMVVSVLNPDVLVITGDLAVSAMLGGINESLYAYSLPRVTRNLLVVPGGLGDGAARVGLTRMLVDEILAPAVIDKLLTFE